MAAAADPPAVANPALAEQDEYEERKSFFHNFLHARREDWEKKISKELASNRERISLDLKDLDDHAGLAREVLENPVKFLIPWQDALLVFVREIDEKYVRNLRHPLKLDITGAFGRNHVTPRAMSSNMLQRLVRVEGIVIKAGVTTPKLLQSMHVTKDEGINSRTVPRVEQRDHRDLTAFVKVEGGGGMPTQDADGNEVKQEIGLSVYKDAQTFNLQETPESAPPGQIPRMIEVVCDSDLTDKCKPGDRVQVIGVYRAFPQTSQDFTDGKWDAKLIATSVRPVKEILEQPFVIQDVKNIQKIAARDDTFQLLGRSFAPSICGHTYPKQGLLLQMVGGTEKNLANGTHLRGDINVLLIGDPSCGKSQMLRFVMNTAPLAISTTGRGSSGVGLTAAIIKEPGSKEFSLEAGAMVLADRGNICIDEFDKMGLGDRTAIHEAMEQQCVTIAKAGMHVTLNARCSVTAAANPIYGNFDPSLDLAKNIGLPDSLLSRFDLVFVIRDITTEVEDRKIATQVLRQCMAKLGSDDRKRGVEQVHSSILERRSEEDQRKATEATEVFEKAYAGDAGAEGQEVVTIDFLRKYLRYCRRFAPKLTPEAQAVISDRYVDMRMRFQSNYMDQADPNAQKKPKLAVTTRTLEALIRLATAHAKLKLRKDHVLPEDVEEAYKLMLYAREEDLPAEMAPAAEELAEDEMEAALIDETSEGPETRGRKRTRDQAGGITSERLDVLAYAVARTYARQQSQEMTRGALLEGVNASLAQGERAFGKDEFDAGLGRLEEKNKIMVTPENDMVYTIG